jgi:hypothetical protein
MKRRQNLRKLARTVKAASKNRSEWRPVAKTGAGTRRAICLKNEKENNKKADRVAVGKRFWPFRGPCQNLREVVLSHWRPGCIVHATRPAIFIAGRILFPPPILEKFIQTGFFG